MPVRDRVTPRWKRHKGHVLQEFVNQGRGVGPPDYRLYDRTRDRLGLGDVPLSGRYSHDRGWRGTGVPGPSRAHRGQRDLQHLTGAFSVPVDNYARS